MTRRSAVRQALVAVGLFVLSIGANAQGYLENPVAGSTESGIGIVSGWHCTAKEITVLVDGVDLGKSGVGSIRNDTAGICGHANTGFSLLFNYNKLAPGAHTISAYADGALLETRQFNSTQSGGVPYLDGMNRDVVVPDFPQPGVTTTLRWSQAKQSFVAIGASTLPGAAPKSMAAEGLWTGNAIGYGPMAGIVAPNGEYWMIYTQGGLITGLVHGTGQVSGAAFASSNTRIYPFGRIAPTAASITASVTPESRFNGTATSTDGSVLFDLLYEADYNLPPNPLALIGTWSGQAGSLGGVTNVSIQITAGGSFIAAAQSGCAYNGTLTPAVGGRNVYDLSISTTAGCSAQRTARGIAVLDGNDLLVAGVLPDRSDAFVAVVARN